MKLNNISKSFCMNVLDLMRGTFCYQQGSNEFFCGERIFDLDSDLFDKYIDLAKQEIPLINAVSISDNSFCLAHTIILKLVCYNAYLNGLFKECAEITWLTADKSEAIRERAAKKCLGTATPQIIGVFDGPQLWLHVYYSPINSEHLKYVVTEAEKDLTKLYEIISNLKFCKK